MPQLPLVNERSVQPSNQPPGYQQVDYNPEAFGAGIGRALRELGQTTQETAQAEAHYRSQLKANTALRINGQMEDELRPWLYDPQNGLYGQKGSNAVGISDQGRTVMDSIKKKYLDQIKDPETRNVVERMWFQTTETTQDNLARHELGQFGAFQADTVKGVVLGAMNDAYNAYNDPKAIDAAITKTRKAISANNIGQPPELQKAAEDEAISSIHLAVISRYAAEDPYAASGYYKLHADEMTGKDHVTATSLVEVARKERLSDEHVARMTGQSSASYDLGAAVEWRESRGNPGAVSRKGALGAMQVMPDTAREVAAKLGRMDIARMDDTELQAFFEKHPEVNRMIGRTYLNEQLRRYGGDVEAALVAYNAGPGAADAFLKANAGNAPGQRSYDVPGWKGLKSETEGYVKDILGYSGGSGAKRGGVMTPENWSLKNFKPDDLLAPTGGGRWIDAGMATAFDEVVTDMKAQFPGMKIRVNEEDNGSGTTMGRRRGTADPKDNPHVANSQHVKGLALDVQIQGWSDEQKAAFLQKMRDKGFNGIGFYGPKGHLHLDMGGERTWGAIPDWAREAMGKPAANPGFQLASYAGQGNTTAGPTDDANNPFFKKANKPALEAWLADAETIADPGVRDRTIAKLRLAAAQMQTEFEQQQAAVKQYAWDTVVQGSIRDLRPEIVSQLEPGFVNSLYEYAKNRERGVMPHDDKVWSQVSMLPENELLRIDPYDYRNQLDDSHFDKLLDLKRAAQNARNGDAAAARLLQNARTTGEIVRDSVIGAGWGTKNSDFEATVGKVRRAVDERILAAQADKGRELNATEIQDIVDKMLLADQSRWGTHLASDPETNPDTFVAAKSWDMVQRDDQATLVSTFNKTFGKDPDKETATDLYNRAMRVYLGGKPDGPKEEQDSIRAIAESGLGYKLNDAAFERYYGKWLLRVLGR